MDEPEDTRRAFDEPGDALAPVVRGRTPVATAKR
jgi:hypothetical protein